MQTKTKNMNIRVSEDDYSLIKQLAEFSGKSISALVMDSLMEQIERLEDLKDIEEYEKEKEDGTLITYSMQEVKERLGL